MEVERIYTATEKGILARRQSKGVNPSQVYGEDTLKSSADVYRDCGGRGLLLYRALLAAHRALKADLFELPLIFKEAIRLNKSDLSYATKKLECCGYIRVTRKPGQKNLFTLTDKGKEGLVVVKPLR